MTDAAVSKDFHRRSIALTPAAGGERYRMTPLRGHARVAALIRRRLPPGG